MVVVSLVAGACGDDNESASGSADTTEYCALIELLDSQDGPPTIEQVTELKKIRPEAIGADTDLVADAFIAADGDIGSLFSDPEIEAAFGRMEAHDAEVCGTGEGEEGAEGDDEPDTEAAAGANVIAVTGIDFGFEGVPAEVPAGLTAFEFTNAGEAAHELVAFKLGDDVELDALLAQEGEPTEEQAKEVGGTFSRPGGDVTYANVELEPGRYAFVCFIPGPEGKAHHELGMKSEFTVV